MAPTAIRLKLDSIRGASTSARHNDEIVVESRVWGMAKPIPAGRGGGGGAGRGTFSDLTVTHRTCRDPPEM